jgi:chromatin modification-related protein VID21
MAKMTRLSKHSWTDSTFLKSAVPHLPSALLLILLYSHSQGAGSIAQLADSEFEFIPSSPYQPSSPPISDIAHDTPSVLPYGSPMSEALSSPSPLPLDAEIDFVAPPEEGSPELGDSRPPSPDTAMEVIEDVSIELPDEEPPSPPPLLQVDPDRPEDASPLPPSISSEAPVAETGADALLAEDLSDIFEDTEQTMVSVDLLEAGPTQLVIESSDEDSKSEGLTSPVTTEQVTVQEDMDVDVVGESRAEADEPVLLTPERRSQSAVTQSPSPQPSQTEGRTSPPPLPPSPPALPLFGPLALPPSAFILPPRPSTEVFIPAALAPIGESPQYSLDLATAEPRSLATNEWLNPEFSLNRNYTLPFAKSLPLDQQRRLKLGKSLRKKDKEKDKVMESRKDGIDDWTPLGINKWGVSIRANPLWKRVSRATKTMSTRDWNVRILSCPEFCDSQRHLGGLHGVAPHSSVGSHRTAQRNRQVELSATQEAAGTRKCIQDALGLSLR